jgi:glutathione synthase/RimK-type ligase-like ATP-grasp enzyme
MSSYKRIMIYPYNVASRSAKILKQALIKEGIPTKFIKKENSKYTPRNGDLVINWGNSATKPWQIALSSSADFTIVNHPNYVRDAILKDRAFHKLHRNPGKVKTPLFWGDVDSAIRHMEMTDNRFDLIIREKLTGHSGEGAHFISRKDVLTHDFSQYNIKMITEYIPKKYEYRIHVAGGNIILIQQKKRNMDIPTERVNWKIRNNSNGFIYAVDDIVPPSDKLRTMAINAVSKLGLQFGAVDVIYNEHRDEGYVLEVNTACGLEGASTIAAYTQLFKTWFKVGTLLPLSSEETNKLSDEDVQKLRAEVSMLMPLKKRKIAVDSIAVDDLDPESSIDFASILGRNSVGHRVERARAEARQARDDAIAEARERASVSDRVTTQYGLNRPMDNIEASFIIRTDQQEES